MVVGFLPYILEFLDGFVAADGAECVQDSLCCWPVAFLCDLDEALYGLFVPAEADGVDDAGADVAIGFLEGVAQGF